MRDSERESGKLAFQWVFMCRLISLGGGKRRERGERRGEDSYSDALPTTGGPEARARGGGTAGGMPVRGELASQGKTNRLGSELNCILSVYDYSRI